MSSRLRTRVEIRYQSRPFLAQSMLSSPSRLRPASAASCLDASQPLSVDNLCNANINTDDTGVVSSTLVSINNSLSHRELTSVDKSIITSATSLFALLTSPFSSIIADRLGHKKVILYADILFVAGALLQAVSSTVLVMVIGRCIIGAAVGAASFVVPLYIAEIAPAAHRGRLVTTNVVFVTLGQMVAYIVGWLLSIYGPPATAWRWMVGLGTLPAALQAVLLVMMPDTPRWLIKVGRQEDARAVIASVHSADEDVDAIVALIEREAREEREARVTRSDRSWMGMDTWRELVHEGKNRRALIIACLLQGLQQLCGFVGRFLACALYCTDFGRIRLCTSRPPYSPWSDSRTLFSHPSPSPSQTLSLLSRR